MISRLPSEVLAARFVRPVRDAVDRAVRSLRAGGSATMGEMIALVRLLGIGYEANELALAGRGDGASGAGGAPLAAEAEAESRGVPPSEFYAPVLSEQLDAMRDYMTYARHGPYERGLPSEGGWSFCSEPWILSTAAKARILSAEAQIKMQQSQAWMACWHPQLIVSLLRCATISSHPQLSVAQRYK